MNIVNRQNLNVSTVNMFSTRTTKLKNLKSCKVTYMQNGRIGVIREVYMQYGHRRDCVEFIDLGDINIIKKK